MFSWLGKRLIGYLMSRTRAGDIRPTLALDAEDVLFVFPGENSWGGVYNGKAAHRAWLERLVRVGIKTEPDEVVVGGLPWKSTICIRGRSWLDSPEGERIYNNRFVIWGKVRWGKLREYEVYEDTEKAAALDEWLAEHERPAGVS